MAKAAKRMGLRLLLRMAMMLACWFAGKDSNGWITVVAVYAFNFLIGRLSRFGRGGHGGIKTRDPDHIDFMAMRRMVSFPDIGMLPWL
jgi:hypothetical protein